MAQIEGVWGQSQQGSGGGLLHFLLLRKALLILASGRLLICGLITRSRSAERPPEASKAASHRGTVCALAPSVDLPWSKALNPEGLAVLSCFKVCEWPTEMFPGCLRSLVPASPAGLWLHLHSASSQALSSVVQQHAAALRLEPPPEPL